MEMSILSRCKKRLKTMITKTVYSMAACGGASYSADGMILLGKNAEFLKNKAFVRAYQAGMNSGHKIGRPKGSSRDIHIEWRALVCLWAAKHAQLLPGDFVECGVNTGIMSLAVCNFIDFNATGKNFFLFDTFEGIPPEQMSETERPARTEENEQFYEDCYETAQRNFSTFDRVVLVRGKVPETLKLPSIDSVCYLSIDMNIAYPEIAAVEFFWDKLVPGAIIVLDDYGWSNYAEQKVAMDEFAHKKNVFILTLPTGQGLIIKR